MKKLLTALIIIMFTGSNAWALGIFGGKEKNKKQGPVKTFFTQKNQEFDEYSAKKQDINEIKELLCLLTKYSNEHNMEKILSLYDKSYRSFDGFNYDTFKEMLEDTFEAYDDISYRSVIKNISLYEDKAVVSLVDYTSATLKSESAKKQAKKYNSPDISLGVLEGECNYAVYLQKINGQWKIVTDNIIAETTSIKYGSARNMEMSFMAPLTVAKDREYCLTLKMTPQKGTKIVASLGKEEILYPSTEPKEIFRKLPQDGILERVVHSNKSGFNEYAIASVGITKMDIAKDLSAIQFQMTGLAFLMQRVNLYTELNPLRAKKEDVKEVKKDAKTKG